MPTCQICQHTLKGKLRFDTAHIAICVRCTNTLNGNPAPALEAEKELFEMLERGIVRRATEGLSSEDDWKRKKSETTLKNIKQEVQLALPAWINKLLAKKENSTRPFKIMRAHRRGLVRYTPGNPYEYPSDWRDVSKKIRLRDAYACVSCGKVNVVLDVHHIVYLSHLGTNRQENLVTLCRKCHEIEHGRDFDFPEAKDPDQESPIQPPRKDEDVYIKQIHVPKPQPIKLVDDQTHAFNKQQAIERLRSELLQTQARDKPNEVKQDTHTNHAAFKQVGKWLDEQPKSVKSSNGFEIVKSLPSFQNTSHVYSHRQSMWIGLFVSISQAILIIAAFSIVTFILALLMVWAKKSL